ncbi:MAG: BBP7 family outer membrane beta-barrel protein [Pirellula sp.]
MSILQRTLRTFVLTAAAMAGQLGFADSGYHPFSEPVDFDPDWQLFAPMQLQDIEDLSPRQRAPYGLFLTYDRIYTGVSRPETNGASYLMDSTWGNRWDFGWMNRKESGWSFSYQVVTGPNVYHGYEQLRLNGYTDSTQNNNNNNNANLPFRPSVFDNDPYTLERTYDVLQSVNVGNYSSFEANKTWRMEPYRYGGMLEPLIGLRYVKFLDTARSDDYRTFLAEDPLDPGTIIGEGEVYTNDLVLSRNDMILGQLGFRYFRNIRRWTLSTDFKVFAGHTFQTQEITRYVTTSVYSEDVAVGDEPISDGDHTGTTFFSRKNNETPVGFDLRAESAFSATKHIDLRVGFQMIYFGQGIWRGAAINQGSNLDTNQHLVMPGVTFGFAVNR